MRSCLDMLGSLETAAARGSRHRGRAAISRDVRRYLLTGYFADEADLTHCVAPRAAGAFHVAQHAVGRDFSKALAPSKREVVYPRTAWEQWTGGPLADYCRS